MHSWKVCNPELFQLKVICPEAEVRPFVFGSDDLSLLGDYYALRLINERFARLARSIFYQCLNST